MFVLYLVIHSITAQAMKKSEEIIERTQKMLASVAKSVRGYDTAALAQALQLDPAKLSLEWEGDFRRFAMLLVMMNFKLVPRALHCLDTKTLETLLHGHRKWLESISAAQKQEAD